MDYAILMLKIVKVSPSISTAAPEAPIGVNLPYCSALPIRSTVSPTLSGELEAAFPRFVALPIVGNPEAVRSGQAVLLAGSDADVVEALEPVLSSLSGTVRRYKTAPLALAAKLTNNLLLLSEVAALAEACAVGRSGGLSDDQLRDLLADNPLLPAALRNRFEGVVTGWDEPARRPASPRPTSAPAPPRSTP